MTLLITIICFLVVAFGFVVFFGAPYVPSHRKEARAAFKALHPLSDKDVVVDLGSGDGVVLRVAAAEGAKAIGYELNPLLVFLSRLFSHRFPAIDIYTVNFWYRRIPQDTTLVYVFSVTRDMARLEEKLQNEADYMGKPFDLILYAMKLPTKKPTKHYRAHILYRFTPLHSKKA